MADILNFPKYPKSDKPLTMGQLRSRARLYLDLLVDEKRRLKESLSKIDRMQADSATIDADDRRLFNLLRAQYRAHSRAERARHLFTIGLCLAKMRADAAQLRKGDE
jgi:hypothetical protein